MQYLTVIFSCRKRGRPFGSTKKPVNVEDVSVMTGRPQANRASVVKPAKTHKGSPMTTPPVECLGLNYNATPHYSSPSFQHQVLAVTPSTASSQTESQPNVLLDPAGLPAGAGLVPTLLRENAPRHLQSNSLDKTVGLTADKLPTGGELLRSMLTAAPILSRRRELGSGEQGISKSLKRKIARCESGTESPTLANMLHLAEAWNFRLNEGVGSLNADLQIARAKERLFVMDIVGDTVVLRSNDLSGMRQPNILYPCRVCPTKKVAIDHEARVRPVSNVDKLQS
jgi:hypothetical protein